MALRSRSRTATVTSGPGRGPSSDGRVRNRARGPRGRRAGRHRATAQTLRLRAESLFPDRPAEPRELGHGPPGGRRGGATAGAGDVEPEDAVAGCAGGGDTLDPGVRGGWRDRVGPAVRERLPLWLQARCGIERKSVVALSVVLVVAAVFAGQHFWAGRTQPVSAPEVVRAGVPSAASAPASFGEEGGGPAAGAGASTGAGAPTAGPSIVVDVSGKVRRPGVQRLPAGSRVADALRAAGGVRPGANTDGLNRARLLVDGEQVLVGGPAGVGAGTGGGAGVGGVAGSVAGGTVAGAGPATPVSLSTATVEQLDTLPGVGPVLAQHIIAYRTEHGGFRSVDELREVNGIGDRRFADLRNLVRP
ncbi:ComEA family DNA-binding protein [Streptomyces heilongjiangensis]|uniref:Helix-hairpin-helix domain-containing protein n=1 Tax=Streptomyces heilongjiangensis TaxID=945052 RepID=A0ABW1BB28_9ACTN|nr:ComEA family DNA-binding protein [Streptomyces heilongjiangensis]MDC2948727.1 ComEA family DNA-binding protein [Streptomyces heilongjiangensis]